MPRAAENIINTQQNYYFLNHWFAISISQEGFNFSNSPFLSPDASNPGAQSAAKSGLRRAHAVDSLSLQVPRGSVFGFLGPNGSGKTTTVRLLLGLLEPDAGSGKVLGNDIVTQDSEIRTISGALLEHNGLYERLSAEKILDYFARIYHPYPRPTPLPRRVGSQTQNGRSVFNQSDNFEDHRGMGSATSKFPVALGDREFGDTSF